MAKQRDQLDVELQRFEQLVDRSDPEQLKLLQEMQEHTRRLHQGRGDWNKPSSHRNWNSSKLPEKAAPPLEDDSYRCVIRSSLMAQASACGST